MRYFIYTIIVAMLSITVTCSTYHNKVRLTEQKTSSSEGTSHFRYDSIAYYQDSVYRMWHLWTDSTFTYHPERGLSASSGWFWLQEKGTHSQLDRLSIDSGRQVQEHQTETVRSVRSKTLRMDYMWIVAVLFLGVLGSLCWRWQKLIIGLKKRVF